MYALAQNSISQTRRPTYTGACKLAVCASLSLAITLLSARLINHSVVQAYTQTAQPAPAQLIAPFTPASATPKAGATLRDRV